MCNVLVQVFAVIPVRKALRRGEILIKMSFIGANEKEKENR